jgi:hypothetical protein
MPAKYKINEISAGRVMETNKKSIPVAEKLSLSALVNRNFNQ